MMRLLVSWFLYGYWFDFLAWALKLSVFLGYPQYAFLPCLPVTDGNSWPSLDIGLSSMSCKSHCTEMNKCQGAVCLIHETDLLYISQKSWQIKSARGRRPQKKNRGKFSLGFWALWVSEVNMRPSFVSSGYRVFGNFSVIRRRPKDIPRLLTLFFWVTVSQASRQMSFWLLF